MTREEAIQNIKKAIGFSDTLDESIFTLFPELKEKESEDERIRKEILEDIRNVKAISSEEYRKKADRWIAWLEKQKEQPQEELVYRLNGLMIEYVKEGKDDAEKEHRFKCYRLFWDALEDADFFEQKEQKPNLSDSVGLEQKLVEWSEEDEEHLKWLCGIIRNVRLHGGLSLKEESELAKWIDKWINHEPQSKNEWSEFDKDCLKQAIWYVENPSSSVVKNTNLVLWLKSLPERFNLQPNQEWSEEDEKMRKNIIWVLESYISHTACESNPSLTVTYPTYYKEVDWFKSLHPQPRKEIYQAAKHDLAIKFMNYLDENRLEGKMSLSNGECEDIDKAFKENDWAKIIGYAKKYQIQQEKKPEVKLKGWVARDRDEEIWVYRDYPKKDFETQEWMPSGGMGTMLLDQKSFPDLKWEDEPVEVEMTIKRR